MQVTAITKEADGSAWSAVVNVQGVAYVASYVANKLTVRLAPYKHNPRRARWHLESVKKWAQDQVGQLPSDWMNKHLALYA